MRAKLVPALQHTLNGSNRPHGMVRRKRRERLRHKTAVALSESMVGRIRVYCAHTGASMGSLVRVALERHLADYERHMGELDG